MKRFSILFFSMVLLTSRGLAQTSQVPVSVLIRAADALTKAPLAEARAVYTGSGSSFPSEAGWCQMPEGDYTAAVSVPGYYDRSIAISATGKDTLVYEIAMLKKGSLMPVEVSWTAPNKAMVKKIRIEDLARILLDNPRIRVAITAFIDRDGGRKMNQKLANDRADAVRAALVRADIDAGRVDTKGALTAVKGKNKAQREANNKVEAVFSE